MERRDFVKTGLAGAAVGLMSSSAVSAQGHQHAADEGKKVLVTPVMSDELKKVAEAAHACVDTATACIAECNRVLATGDGSMAECQQAVLSMISVCEATASNARMNFIDEELMRSLIGVCAEFCDYCADACEAHAEHNIECKNCMDSCNECADACRAYLEA